MDKSAPRLITVARQTLPKSTRTKNLKKFTSIQLPFDLNHKRESSEFSRFIRLASAKEKESVFREVIQKAIEMQNNGL